MKKLLTLILILLSITVRAAAPNDSTQIQVISVHKLGTQEASAELFDILVVRVKGFHNLLKKINSVGGANHEVKLFLDGRQIDGLPIIVGEPKNDEDDFQFKLERNKTNDAAWTELLGSPDARTFFTRPMDVSVGIDKSFAEESIARVNFIRIEEPWFYGCVAGLLLYFGTLIYFCRKSNILRNPNIDLSALNITEPDGTLTSYSMGKVQMAFWFSLVVTSFLFIWLITDNYDLITPGILGLIGISGATALGATVIDTNKHEDAIKKVLDLQQQQNTVVSTLNNLRAISPAVPTTAGDILFNENLNQQLSTNIDRHLKALQLRTKGFLHDILTDVNGYNFHRLQMFTWTLVLGFVFIYSVWSSLTMPDFSSTMLAVQGITAGTYLGFKFPEKQA